MAPSSQAASQRYQSNSSNSSKKSLSNRIKSIQRDYININFIKSLLFDPAQLPIVSIAILVTELVLNVLIVQRVNYTEIDWIAYMQQCEGFLNGTTNYAQLRGTYTDDDRINITSFLHKSLMTGLIFLLSLSFSVVCCWNR